MMTDEVEFLKTCRFCGLEKNTGKSLFGFEAAQANLLEKIKNLFPLESELFSPKGILPQFICTTCEATLNYFDEFRSSVKLVQQALIKRMFSTKDETNCTDHNPNTVQHICSIPEGNLLVIRFDKDDSIYCNSCDVKLHRKQIPYSQGSCYGVCSTCGYKNTIPTSANENTKLICAQCSNNEANETLPSASNEIVKNFQCDLCKKSYHLKSHLNRHRVTHSSTKPFTCPDCGLSFWQKSSLQRHSLIHQKLNPFSCKWCGQTFRHRQTCTSHETSIHGVVSSAANIFECGKCKKKFGSKEKLERHYRSHSGEKPFKCDICSKAFSQRINLKTHYRRHESEIQFATAPSTVVNVAETSQGDLIQELLNFNNTPPEADPLQPFSMVDGQYTENIVPVKPSDTSKVVYYNSSSFIMYSSDSILYDLDNPVESTPLPDFSRLNSQSVKTELSL